MKRVSYDEKCAELAAHFLSDFQVEGGELETHIDKLAQEIQAAIEGYISYTELKERGLL